MKEQIVSFKTAKLAKEKGFNWDCDYVYKLNSNKVSDVCNKFPDKTFGEITNGVVDNYFEVVASSPFFSLGDSTLAANNNLTVDTYFNFNDEVLKCTAPTQTLLQKWLRDTHNIHVYVNHYSFAIEELDGYFFHIGKSVRTNVYYEGPCAPFNTYEDTLEKGLFEALTTLILQKRKIKKILRQTKKIN